MSSHVTRLEQDQDQASPTYIRWKWVCSCGANTPYQFLWQEARGAAHVHRTSERLK